MDILTLKLRGMSCASCARNVEETIRSVPGVSECNVNFGAEQATVNYDPRKTNLEKIQDGVEAAAYFYSLFATLFPRFFINQGLMPEVYYETAAVVITLI
jgi:copper chaperone CopZ